MSNIRHRPAERDLSRRELMKVAGVGFLGLATPGLLPHPAFGDEEQKKKLTPKEIIEILYEGNRRFVLEKPEAPHRDFERIKDIQSGQKPIAAFLGCADSRVPIEVIFDQGFGDLFVTRIAGNVTTPECIASLEFGTHVLGAKVLYILGHTKCGAVEATAKGDPVPGQISALFQHIQPAVREANGDLDEAIRKNVRIQAKLLSEASPKIAELISDGELLVAGGVYDLGSGRVDPVEV